MAEKKGAPLFAVGVFFGVLVGSVLTFALSSSDKSETYEDYAKRQQKQPGRTAPRRRNGGGGGDDAHGRGGHGGGRKDPRVQIAKVHFMKKFVKALTALPQNAHPAPDYKPLLKDVKNPISCSNCHKDSTLDFEKMAQNDPGDTPFVQQLRSDPRFMIPLMTKWVERLNGWHGDRLANPVTCTTCHAVDPKDKFDVYPALMHSFVMALKRKPTNKNPAVNWKPLLKDAGTRSMLCAYCHGDIGSQMENFLPDPTDPNKRSFDLTRPKKYADNKAFMVDLMDDWVKDANKNLGEILTKPLTCLDCHDSDPRR